MDNFWWELMEKDLLHVDQPCLNDDDYLKLSYIIYILNSSDSTLLINAQLRI